MMTGAEPLKGASPRSGNDREPSHGLISGKPMLFGPLSSASSMRYQLTTVATPSWLSCSKPARSGSVESACACGGEDTHCQWTRRATSCRRLPASLCGISLPAPHWTVRHRQQTLWLGLLALLRQRVVSVRVAASHPCTLRSRWRRSAARGAVHQRRSV